MRLMHPPRELGGDMKKGDGQKLRLCDYCSAAPALLYCRPDSAKLCLRCDRDVHFTNPLFTKHTRSLLCDRCDSASASVFCEAHRSVLCSNCDWDAHDGAVHNRRPIEGFSGCPSASEILGALGFDEVKDTLLAGDDVFGGGLADSLLWETPSFVTLDDLIVSSENFEGLQACDVPPLPRNRNATCGKRREEILRQIRLLASSETYLNLEDPGVCEPVLDLQFQDSKPTPKSENNYASFGDQWESLAAPDSEVVAFQWLGDDGDMTNQVSNSLAVLSSYCDENPTNPEKQPEISSLSCANESQVQSENPITENMPAVLPRVDLSTQERESAISRYKEKRKSRRYDKHIRYEFRKVRAESRTRVKGRFAKTDHHM
ncbi:hypothetical protein SAY87_025172 [Trapa incisa]|uniref:Zinc finger protein CONSTANS-LIKE 13 n=1 Tax=Trapa incisa TaxID=236973 RepID=A0AAN7GQE4_9MYRT|nr:hypothetical protein SAY87_025172 [Trapa incisa]